MSPSRPDKALKAKKSTCAKTRRTRLSQVGGETRQTVLLITRAVIPVHSKAFNSSEEGCVSYSLITRI